MKKNNTSFVDIVYCWDPFKGAQIVRHYTNGKMEFISER